MNRQNLARLGEEKAKQYLLSKGYKILEKNFRSRYGEIDIVALDKDTLVFVEVKTRYSEEYGKPEEAITKRKLHLVARTGQFYKLTHKNLPDLLRIDAVLIEMDPGGQIDRCELIQNAEL